MLPLAAGRKSLKGAPCVSYCNPRSITPYSVMPWNVSDSSSVIPGPLFCCPTALSDTNMAPVNAVMSHARLAARFARVSIFNLITSLSVICLRTERCMPARTIDDLRRWPASPLEVNLALSLQNRASESRNRRVRQPASLRTRNTLAILASDLAHRLDGSYPAPTWRLPATLGSLTSDGWV